MTTKPKAGNAPETTQAAQAKDATQQADRAAAAAADGVASTVALAKEATEKQPTAAMPRDAHTGTGGAYKRLSDGTRVRI